MPAKKFSIKNELVGVKDMIGDLVPRLTGLLDPNIFQSTESLQAAFISIATGFLQSRISGFFEDIAKTRESIDVTILESAKTKQVLIDVTKFAAQENPDTEVWDAIKKIFIRTLQQNTEDKERASLYELLSICKELTGTEIKILAGAYQISKAHSELNGNNRMVESWATEVARKIGLDTSDEILRYEDSLVRQRLISPREVLRGDVLNSWNPAGESQRHRLTPLGRKLAKALTT